MSNTEKFIESIIESVEDRGYTVKNYVIDVDTLRLVVETMFGFSMSMSVPFSMFGIKD